MRVIATAAAVTLLAPIAAWAANDIPFAITGAAGGTVSCRGPGIGDIVPRLSGCRRFDARRREVFYAADDNIFSLFGSWSCSIFTQCGESEIPEDPKAEVAFCLSSGYVELEWDGDASLTANQPRFCTSALVHSVLGQTGEGDSTPAQDIDSFTFAGKTDERVEFTLGRDGTAGSIGQIATLRVRARSGGVVGERTGAVPIKLELNLPGPVEVAVIRNGARSGGDAFRGYYSLEARPQSGNVGRRQLVPSVNVEH